MNYLDFTLILAASDKAYKDEADSIDMWKLFMRINNVPYQTLSESHTIYRPGTVIIRRIRDDYKEIEIVLHKFTTIAGKILLMCYVDNEYFKHIELN